MVGAAGLEPATLCLEGRCSIHLSYAPDFPIREFALTIVHRGRFAIVPRGTFRRVFHEEHLASIA
jgi:hypothetical protein